MASLKSFLIKWLGAYKCVYFRPSEYILTLYLDNKCRPRHTTEQHMGCSSYKYKNIKSLQNFSFSIIFTHAMSELLWRRQCRLFNIKLAVLFKMGPQSQPADWAFSSNKTSISVRLRYFATFRNVNDDHTTKNIIAKNKTYKKLKVFLNQFSIDRKMGTFQDDAEGWPGWLFLFRTVQWGEALPTW